jgi:nitrate reductase gamma subunit
MRTLFGVLIPYLAWALFVSGVVWKILAWVKAPVPFCIPTTCGQQRSLDWIKPDRIDNPFTGGAVLVRMLLEVLCFRSLFRNTRSELVNGPRLTCYMEKWLWLSALAFHWSFLVIVLRHLRFFLEPVPAWIGFLQYLDGFYEYSLQSVFASGVVILLSVSYLFLRRVMQPEIRYISLPADYFPLLVVGGVVVTGLLMRYFIPVDIVAAKQLALGLVTFHPVSPPDLAPLFYIHLFLLCILISYFPFSKLMHMGGVFLSPTRNLANNSRAIRHINPWNYPVHVHTYSEYEDEFRDKMKGAGLPVDKE